MNSVQRTLVFSLAFFIGVVFLTIPGIAATMDQYLVNFATVNKYKKVLDDPRPLYKDLPLSKLLPPAVYKKLVFDIPTMKKEWAKAVGFRAPDVVNQSVLKPGVYIYKDKAKYPALKKLMIPELYKEFNAGGPPLAGNFEKITVIPTRQYYWALPIAEATLKNEGKAKLDDQGYIDYSTYKGGYPFPKPSGKFKAQEILYDWEQNYTGGDSFYAVQRSIGFNSHLTIDMNCGTQAYQLRLFARAEIPPLGWFDKRAKDKKEMNAILMKYSSPRDLYGNGFVVQRYVAPNKVDRDYAYVNAMRRIRQMSGTDTQDAVGGMDLIYEDSLGFSQKLSKTRYPYKFQLLGEGNYLVPALIRGGSTYMRSKGGVIENLKMEIRPMYVVKLTSIDPNFVYSYRIMYFDRETLNLDYIENYDQRGRLYRTCMIMWQFAPKMGLDFPSCGVEQDHVDLHTTWSSLYTMPAPWLNRSHIDIGALYRGNK